MFSTVQHKIEGALSYFGYGSKPSEGLPKEIHKSLKNQELSAESTLKDYRVASTPPSIWKRVASLGMNYLVFSSGQSNLQETLSSGVVGYVSEPWALPFTFVAGLSIFPDMVHAQSPNENFLKTLGNSGGERGHALIETSEGDLIVAGETTSFGAGNFDVLLTKLSRSGTLLWAKTLGGVNDDSGFALTATTEGDLIVAGSTRSFGEGDYVVLLSKFSSNGTLIWANTLGGAYTDQAHALTATPEGDLIVVGSTRSFGAGNSDVLLAKFSNNGTLLWANVLGGEGFDHGFALTVTSERDLIVAGSILNFGGGSDDVLLSKFSSNGTLLWANALNGGGGDRGHALAVTSEGDLIVAGYTYSFGAGTYDVLLSKFLSNGTLLWANALGGVSNDEGVALTATPEGDLIVAGFTYSFSVGDPDVLLSKFSSNGTLLWANTLDGINDEYGRALTVTSEGDLVVTGYTSSFNVGGSDVLLAKFNAQGSIGNCSACQSVTPQVQSITPNITDVTLNLTIGIPPWTSQDARSVLNVTDITSLMNQTTVCYEQTVANPTLFTSADVTSSSQSPSKSFSTNSLPFSSQSLSSNSPLSSPKASPSTTPVNQEVTERSRTTSSPTLIQTNSSTSNTGILSIREISYGQSYPIQIGGEEIGTFTFSGGEGFVNPNGDNLITIEFHDPSDIEDGSLIARF